MSQGKTKSPNKAAGKQASLLPQVNWAPGPVDQSWPASIFNVNCRDCERLAAFHDKNRHDLPEHFNGPVPPFGDKKAQFLIVGLAPGLHGANRTGRPFTGDFCGDLLYSTLHQFGFANGPESTGVHDGFELINARVSNAVKCVPPQNKPLPIEIKQCNSFFKNELDQYQPKVLMALGLVAHQAVLKALNLKLSAFKFAHGAEHDLGDFILIDSYHVSRYNTQTGRLTPPMFEAVIGRVKQLLT